MGNQCNACAGAPEEGEVLMKVQSVISNLLQDVKTKAHKAQSGFDVEEVDYN